ncbi:MAG: acyltransferase [Parcubacteria group bacterium]
MKALHEVGFLKALRFGLWVPLLGLFSLAGYPQVRMIILRIFGARIRRSCIIHRVKFMNAYRKGFGGVYAGEEVFIGDECLLDLAESITFEDQVTLAERVVVLTHMNVGYRDHPLQKYFPAFAKPVVIKQGSFIGANVTILPGVTIGPRSFVAAGSVVTKNVLPDALVGGVPARQIRNISIAA